MHTGYKTGVYPSWPECKLQVDGFSNPKYRKFSELADAEEFVKWGYGQPRETDKNNEVERKYRLEDCIAKEKHRSRSTRVEQAQVDKLIRIHKQEQTDDTICVLSCNGELEEQDLSAGVEAVNTALQQSIGMQYETVCICTNSSKLLQLIIDSAQEFVKSGGDGGSQNLCDLGVQRNRLCQ